MGNKKSMRVFLLSLCLLAVSGAVIIGTMQYQTYRNAATGRDRMPGDAGQAQEADKSGQTIGDSRQANPAETGDVKQNYKSSTDQTRPASVPTALYLFEMKVKDGYLEVYHYHTEQLFFHTGIAYSSLTATQQEAIQKGKYFRDEQELYGYLESCTS